MKKVPPGRGASDPSISSPWPDKRSLTVVEPPRQWPRQRPQELWRYRDLFLILAGRDIKVRYRQTVVGVAWVILQPILTALIFTVVFGFFVRLPSGGVPYVLFVLCGLLPWTYFSNSVQRVAASLYVDTRLVSKVYFPRLLIPFASVASGLIDFCATLIVLFILLFAYRVPLTWHALSLPFLALLVTLAALGVGLWFSALSVRYRDARNLLPFMLQAWLYATPVVYAVSLVPAKWRGMYSLNPSVGIVDGFRWALLGATTFSVTTVVVTIGGSVILLASGLATFLRMQQRFDDSL